MVPHHETTGYLDEPPVTSRRKNRDRGSILVLAAKISPFCRSLTAMTCGGRCVKVRTFAVEYPDACKAQVAGPASTQKKKGWLGPLPWIPRTAAISLLDKGRAAYGWRLGQGGGVSLCSVTCSTPCDQLHNAPSEWPLISKKLSCRPTRSRPMLCGRIVANTSPHPVDLYCVLPSRLAYFRYNWTGFSVSHAFFGVGAKNAARVLGGRLMLQHSPHHLPGPAGTSIAAHRAAPERVRRSKADSP
jgi:hypothetical protein